MHVPQIPPLSPTQLAPPQRRTERWWATVVTGVAAALVLGCGSAPAKRVSLADKAAKQAKRDLGAYTAQCAKRAAAFAKDVAAKRYLPATVRVHSWTGDGAKAGDQLSESELLGKLGGQRVTLLMARGGLGKSRLSDALEAQACSKYAAARVDLKWDLASAKNGDGTLIKLVAKRLTGEEAQDPGAAVKRVLHGRTLLLLLDSLDEVSLDRRPMVVAQVEAALSPFAAASAVVFTRPPVFSANYGFAQISARLELPMLSCAGTQRAMRELVGGDAQLANFLEFTKRYGLDRMVVRSGGRCWYPHMATYRDLLVLRQISDNMAKATPAPGSALSSRAGIYEFLLAVSVIKDLSGLKLMPKDLLALVDRMVQAQNPSGTQRNLGFTVGGCLARSQRADAAEGKKLCERLMQSSLFRETNRPDTWQFRNQSLGDLFLARWVHSGMDDGKGGADCAVISKHSALFESNEVAGFLVGMPRGQACLLPVVQELCSKSGDEATSVELLDQGLPPGKTRATVLQSAVDASGDAMGTDSCLARTLKALAAILPAGTVRLSKPAPATAKAPAKRPKRGKRRKGRKRP